jgi:hypothetical protein
MIMMVVVAYLSIRCCLFLSPGSPLSTCLVLPSPFSWLRGFHHCQCPLLCSCVNSGAIGLPFGAGTHYINSLLKRMRFSTSSALLYCLRLPSVIALFAL